MVNETLAAGGETSHSRGRCAGGRSWLPCIMLAMLAVLGAGCGSGAASAPRGTTTTPARMELGMGRW
jgi:hypothetical protein